MDNITVNSSDIPVTTDQDFAGLVDRLIEIINSALIPLLLACLLVFIIYKVIDVFLIHADDEQKRAAGRQLLLISVIVMSVIVAIWGIVAFLRMSVFGT